MREGWKTVKLGEVCSVIAGQSPKGSAYNDQGNGLPFYQGKKHFGKMFIGDPTTWTTQVTKEAYPGDILMSVRAPVGPINFSTQRICIGRGLSAIRAGATIDSKYLFYSLLFKQDEIKGNEGAVFASINKKQIENMELLLPPLPEQKRIIAILDEAFAGIEKAVANTEKNLANARELFEGCLNDVFRKQGKGWPKKKLSSLSKIEYGYTASAKPDTGGIKFLRITDIQNGRVDWKKVPTCNIDPSHLPKHKLKKGDIVFARTGATTGKSFLLDTPPKAVFASYLIRVQLTIDFLLPEFVYMFFQSDNYWREIKKGVSGSAQGGFNASKLGELKIPVPQSIAEQRKIVRALNDLNGKAVALESIFQQKFTALSELKQSLLQKAFSGDLAAKDSNKATEAAA